MVLLEPVISARKKKKEKDALVLERAGLWFPPENPAVGTLTLLFDAALLRSVCLKCLTDIFQFRMHIKILRVKKKMPEAVTTALFLYSFGLFLS